jgi:hypothetical protein
MGTEGLSKAYQKEFVFFKAFPEFPDRNKPSFRAYLAGKFPHRVPHRGFRRTPKHQNDLFQDTLLSS